MSPRPISRPRAGDSGADVGLATRLRDWTPTGITPPELPPADVSYAVHDTPVGRILLACNDSGVVVSSVYVADAAAEERALMRLAGALSPRVLRQPGRLDQVRREIDAYLAGSSRTFSVPVELTLAGDFQRQILTTLAARVGYGERASYGELAAWAERPGAARAVGAALGANPLVLLLPCHRVVGRSGSLTGYAGGLAAKTFLLELEARPGKVPES